MDNVFSNIGASNHSNYERQAEDFYASDYRVLGHLLKKEPQLYNYKRVMEPCAGNGVLLDTLKTISEDAIGYDIVQRRDDIIVQNYYDLDCKGKYNLIVTNPPYMKAKKGQKGLTDMINKMLDDVDNDGYVCLFLKTLHLESIDRYKNIYKDKRPVKVYVYSPRVGCYRNDDRSLPKGAISYSWYVWYKDKDGNFSNTKTELDWISEL